LLFKGPCTVSELATQLGISRSWCSRGISHLTRLGFVEPERKLRRSRVRLSHGTVGNSLLTLLGEDPMLDIVAVLSGRGLTLLPYLIPPGSTVDKIVSRSGLSARTVRPYLKRWRAQGIVQVKKRVYFLLGLHPYLIQFVQKFDEERIARVVKELAPDANILWSDKGECLFSSERPVGKVLLTMAGPSALAERGEDIIYSHRYFLYSPLKRKVSKEEALVQSLVIDRVEPRIKRLIIEYLKDRHANRKRLESFSREYGIEKLLMEVLGSVCEKSP